MKRTMTCFNKISLSGRTCWGKLFQIERKKENVKAICIKCGKEYDLKE